MNKYPKQITLMDGTKVVIRPLEAGDGPALLALFTGLTEKDKRFLREDVTDKKLIDKWVGSIDLDKVVPLVAVDDGKIVGDVTLHHSKLGNARHIGEVRIVVAPDHRKKGLGTAMIEEVLALASRKGLEKLIAKVVSEESGAVAALKRLGFQQVAVLPEMFKTTGGATYDLIFMSYALVTDWDAF